MLIFYLLLFSLCYSSELFEDYYEEAEKYLKKMTLEQKVNQMFFPKYNSKRRVEDFPDNIPGGYVLYEEHFNYTDSFIQEYVSEMINITKNVTGLPLGLAVDEEGGNVYRISNKHRKNGTFPSPQKIFNESGIEGILSIDQEKRDLLRTFYMNVNLAPVADISYNSSDYMYHRTLGKLPKITADYIAKDVEGYVNDNFTCCAKHFPGYGNNTNTHLWIAIDDRDYDIFVKEDFLPFQASIKNKIPMILVSHNIVKCKDPDYPASISKEWVGILRNELKFSGLIITDDLSMNAITLFSHNESSSVLAVKAGNDLIITNNYRNHSKEVVEAVKSGNITENVIDTAVRRIIAWKLKYLEGLVINKKNKDDDNNYTLTIVLGSVGGIILIAIVVFLIVRCKKKNNSIDIEAGGLLSNL